jgi:protein-S-isoprenylcysteine O-methyltransferase Ste14
LDRRLHWPRIPGGAARRALGAMLAAAGLALALWSIAAQVTRGRGTPLPVMPTQRLLTDGPFRYCRNPMALGTILAYLGLGIWLGTFLGIGLALLLSGLLILYIKRVEERELAERFGEAYRVYKQAMGFMVPRRPAQANGRQTTDNRQLIY